MREPIEIEAGGSGSAGDAGSPGNRSGEEAAPNGAPTTGVAPDSAGTAGGDGGHVAGSTEAAPNDHRRAGGTETGARHTKAHRSGVSRRDFIRVFNECRGNLLQVAGVLNITHQSAKERAARIPELNGQNGQTAQQNGGFVPPPPPNEGATLLRTPAELPATIAAADLGQMVAVTEKLLGGGFKKLGVPQATIDKLRNLSALRIDAGAMLAVSLQDTHQLYYLQLLSLTARADEIKARYLSEDLEKDGPPAEGEPKVEKLDPTARMFWQRAHTEIVEQLGRGYDRMMAGTQAMVAMMKAGSKTPHPVKSDAGWSAQVPKSVSRAAAREKT